MRKIELLDGEYTVINELGHGGGLRALRYGKEWRNLAGDNLVLALFSKIEDLEEVVTCISDIISDENLTKGESFDKIAKLIKEESK